MPDLEIEVKYYINDLGGLAEKVKSVNAELIQPHVHEYNLRFDTPDHLLTKQHKVLRLRKDQQVHLTYKDPALSDQPVSIRREIELEVSDFEHAKHLLEALGFTDITIYEKYRTTFSLQNNLITLDEMPFGNFAEIESGSALEIEELSKTLGLSWENRHNDSYMALFQRVIQRKKLKIQHLTFELFRDQIIRAEDFNLKPADLPS